jgi:NodT family efflux transporter outer membrane factor (OMF) lipoprotein
MGSGELGLTGTSVAIAQSDWWSGYQDPQLDQLMRDALQRNPTLAVAMARVREAQAISRVTRAARSPAASYNTTEIYQRFSDTDVIPPPFAGTSQWEGHEGLDLSWDLDFWGRQSALIQQSDDQLRATALDGASAQLALSGALVRAYIELDHTYRLCDIAVRTEQQRLQILDITRRRLKAGIDTNVELRQAEGAVPQARVDLTQAQAEQSRSVHRLIALSGQSANAYLQIRRPTFGDDPLPSLPDSLPVDLLSRRPDVQAARSRVDAATAGLAAAKAAFYPDIDLLAFAGTSAIGFRNLFQAASRDYGIGPAIHLPLFDAGRLKAEYRGNAARIDEATANYNDTVLEAVRQTADQIVTIEKLDEGLLEQEKSLEDADDAYHLAEERYKAGVATYLTVLNTETQVLNTHRQRVDMLAARAVARVTLLLALGGGFDPRATPPASAETHSFARPSGDLHE